MGFLKAQMPTAIFTPSESAASGPRGSSGPRFPGSRRGSHTALLSAEPMTSPQASCLETSCCIARPRLACPKHMHGPVRICRASSATFPGRCHFTSRLQCVTAPLYVRPARNEHTAEARTRIHVLRPRDRPTATTGPSLYLSHGCMCGAGIGPGHA